MKELTNLKEYKTASSAKEYEAECYRVQQWYSTDENHLHLRKGYWERWFSRGKELICIIRYKTTT